MTELRRVKTQVSVRKHGRPNRMPLKATSELNPVSWRDVYDEEFEDG